jgi:hypothetical protein
MSIMIAYLESSQKIESDEYDIIGIDEIIFLVVSIFRHTKFSNGLLVVPDIFGVFTIFRWTVIFSMSIFSRVIFSKGGHHAG